MDNSPDAPTGRRRFRGRRILLIVLLSSLALLTLFWFGILPDVPTRPIRLVRAGGRAADARRGGAVEMAFAGVSRRQARRHQQLHDHIQRVAFRPGRLCLRPFDAVEPLRPSVGGPRRQVAAGSPQVVGLRARNRLLSGGLHSGTGTTGAGHHDHHRFGSVERAIGLCSIPSRRR